MLYLSVRIFTYLNKIKIMTTELSDRQKEIIKFSLELISESGIQGFTIKNLARKVGFSESAIYRHYENKTEILVGILNYFKENSERIFIAEQNSERGSVSKIEYLFTNQFRIFSVTPSLVAVIFSEELFRNETVLLEKVSEIMNNNFNTLTKIFKVGQEKEEIRTDIEASHIAVMVMGSLRMFVKQWHMVNCSFDLVEKGNELSKSIKIMIKK
jgi:TetR/AcrR family fatty acid metabolism transcriptional regulator